jgi:hypothetical protein
MRIAPRTMLCGTARRVHERVAGPRFDELQELCAAAGDKASLAIAMIALVLDHAHHAHVHKASQLASEAMALIESIGDPGLTVGLSWGPTYAKGESGERSDALRWSQRVIDLADGDPSKGNLLFGSPLAIALAQRGTARYAMGLPGWRDDLSQALTMARSTDALSYATVVGYVYIGGLISGVLTATDLAIRDIEDALQMADRSSDNFALALVRMTLGLALVHRPTDADRDRGEQLLTEVRETFLLRGHNMCELQLVNVYLARERARRGDHNDVVPQMRDAVDELVREGRLLAWGIPTTGVLVDTLLDRDAEDDVAEAEVAVERLAAAPSDDVITLRDILLLRLRALLGRAHGDADMYYQLRDRYGDMAKTLGFEGHIAWAETMP